MKRLLISVSFGALATSMVASAAVAQEARYGSTEAAAAMAMAPAPQTSDGIASDQTASGKGLDQEPASGSTTGDIIVTGTRTSGLKASDSPAPIQVLGATALRMVGPPDLIQAISQNLPSFNAQGFGGDTANLTLSAALRGLNPNDTLVLVNGKRRHTTANLAVNAGSPYSGASTADLALIPVDAIARIEVLQDGAAAQYGSDAIAGVVNIILKDASQGGLISVTGGQYYQGGGKTGAWSINDGMKLGDQGFINLTVEGRYHDFSQQGSCDRRYYNVDCTLKSTVSAVDAGLINNPNAPRVNQLYGDPRYTLYNVFANAGYDFGGVQAFATASYSHRDADSYENYRPPSKISGRTSAGVLYYPFPTGFSPRETLKEDDFSVGGGLKGDASGWAWSLSGTYGQDKNALYTTQSANAVLFPLLAAQSATQIIPQTDFYDGTFRASELAVNLDVVKNFELGLTKPVVLAFGGEFLRNVYEITSGESPSYYGTGAQSFTGYDPTNAGTHTRRSYAAYVDLAVTPAEGLHLDLAGRYSHYSDFGSATVGKATGRYDFSPKFALRGTVANGFRAPTLAEEYYSGTNVSPAFASVQLPANSPAAAIAGFAPLQPEKSMNYSAGFVAHPAPRLQVTLDAYEIDIRKRIEATGFLYGSQVSGGQNNVVSQAILNAITAHGNTLETSITYAGIAVFTNGANTRTRGAELTVNYASDFDDYGHVDWTLGLNYNQTKLTKIYPLPAQDVSAVPAVVTQNTLLTQNAISAIETGAPRVKAIGNALWRLNNLSVNLRGTIYGRSSIYATTSNVTTNLVVPTAFIGDIDIGYKLTHGLKLDVGANNVFNKVPPRLPFLTALGKPANGGNVYDAPILYGPYGINGGYYYARLTLTF